MAILKMKDINKMPEKDRKEKLKDLKLELIKANVTANKTNAKTKELKRAVARLNTIKFNPSEKEVLKKK